MSEWIDHAAIADSRLAAALPWLSSAGRSDLGQVANILAAQGHATLALVEQQRIANLIALAGVDSRDDEGLDLLRAEASDRLAQWVPTSTDDEHPEIHPDIAAALGIGDPR